MNPRDFIGQHLMDVNEGNQRVQQDFYPPVPIQEPKPRAVLSGSGLLLELVPTLARVTVELERADQKRVNFQPGCPARLQLERILGLHILDCDTTAAQSRLIWLSRIARHALEVGDELHQWDGQPCLQFAAGFVAGEQCLTHLFVGADGEAAAQEYAAREFFGSVGVANHPFSLGFQTRRDQLRAARQAEIDSM